MTKTNKQTVCGGVWRMRLLSCALIVCGVLGARSAAARPSPADCTMYGLITALVNCFEPVYYRVWENGNIVEEYPDNETTSREKCLREGFPRYIAEEDFGADPDWINLYVVWNPFNHQRGDGYQYFRYDPDSRAFETKNAVDLLGRMPFTGFQASGDVANEYPGGANNAKNHIRWWAARWGGGPGYSGAVECVYKSDLWMP